MRFKNDVKLAKYSLAKGADKKQKDADGDTAVNWIIITPAAEMHKLLNEQGSLLLKSSQAGKY